MASIEVRHGPVASLEIALGDVAQLVAALRDGAGYLLQDRAVVWNSTDSGVLQVDPVSGIFTVGSLGTATVTAVAEGVSASANFQVSNEPVALVSVAPESVTLEIGSTIQLSAATQDATGQLLSGRTVTWSSSNEGVVQISATGVVTTVSVGSSNITATSEGVQGAAVVTVTQVPVAFVALSSSNAVVEEGSVVQFSVEAQGAGGQALTGRPVSWSSSDETVAQVSANGLATGVSAGVVTLSATSEGVAGTASLEVTHGPVASVEIGLGAGAQLVAIVLDGSGHLLIDRAVTWSTSDPGVLGVEAQTGLFTVGTVGDATVTATVEGVIATANITVNPEPVASVLVTPDPAALEVGASIQLAAAPQDGSGNLLTGRSVSWTSADEGVATVSVTGLVTGISAGTVTIEATAEGFTGTAQVAVAAQSTVDYSLLWSVSFDRISPMPLEGATVSRHIYVYTGPDRNVDRVSFYLDDLDRENSPYRSETAAPYDLTGTHRDRTANSYDTRLLSADSSHTITAEITLMDGTTVLVTANFRVETTQEVPPPLTPEDYSLLWSASSNRSNAALLEGATLPEFVYVFTDPDQGVTGVSFYLDDRDRRSNPYRSESAAPYDLAGTQSNDNANSYDTGQLSNGEHTITAGITFTDGSTVPVTATFKVETPEVAPPPPLAPESYSLRRASSSNRGNWVPLHGDTVSGNIYVFAAPEDGVDRVSFYLDDQNLKGSPYRTESVAPYDLAGTLNNDRARSFDSSQLGIGTHTITGEITFTDGTTVKVTARFIVELTPIASVEIDPQGGTVAVGNFLQLTATPRDAAGNRLTDREVTWTSSNPEVTIVSSSATSSNLPFYTRDPQGDVVTYGSNVVSVSGFTGGESAIIIATADGVRARVRVRVIFPFSSVSAGPTHTCGVTPWGDTYCWGAGNSGRLGNNSTEHQAIPVPVSGFSDFRSVSAGGSHTCGVTLQDDAYCWGSGSSHGLGNGSTEDRPFPVRVSGELKFKSVSAGKNRTCGITLQDEAYCWGSGTDGALGNGSTADQPVPVAVLGNRKFKSISTSAAEGGTHTCGVTISGDAYCWGRGWAGQLGDGVDGSPYFQDEPVDVLGGHQFTLVSVGVHTCGLTTLGKIYCWGYGGLGQLGNGTEIFDNNANEPVEVLSEHTFQSLSAGSNHTCAITVQGEIYCWGLSASGQLGGGFTDGLIQSTPALVFGEHSFKSVSAGRTHTCGVTTDDETYCWGDDFFGQLGDDPINADQNTPVPVSPPVQVREICRIDNVPDPDEIHPHGTNDE